MWKRFFFSESSRTLFFQRLVLGAVILPHGLQKLCGWFGGFGFDASMKFLTETEHAPAPLAFLVVIAESLGALALIVGVGTRLAAFGIVTTMIGAVFLAHLANGFFMNWFGNQAGEGFEFHLLALALGIPLIIRGAGAWSFDRVLVRFIDRGVTAQAL